MAGLPVVVEHVLALVASIGCLVVILATVGGHCMTSGEAYRFGSRVRRIVLNVAGSENQWLR